jgi:hypothetical protein
MNRRLSFRGIAEDDYGQRGTKRLSKSSRRSERRTGQLRKRFGRSHSQCGLSGIHHERRKRPHDDTETLFSRAQLPKQLWFVPKAGHVDLHKAAGAENESRILAFLEQM